MTQPLRVWHIQNPPCEGEEYPVSSPDEAVKLIRALAKSDLVNTNIVTNAFGLVVFEDGEWNEWYDDEGRDIDEYEKEVYREV